MTLHPTDLAIDAAMAAPADDAVPEAHWNYRVVEVTKGIYELRVVHYNRGREIGMTDSAPIFASTAEDGESDEACRNEIVQSLERALADARSRPILIPPARWS